MKLKDPRKLANLYLVGLVVGMFDGVLLAHVWYLVSLFGYYALAFVFVVFSILLGDYLIEKWFRIKLYKLKRK